MLAFAADLSPVVAASSVTNSFVVESNTGGNVVQNGRVVEGSEESSVSITTVIDGEVVVDIQESSQGEPILLEQTVEASTSDAVVTTLVQLNNESEAASSIEKRSAVDSFIALTAPNTSDENGADEALEVRQTNFFGFTLQSFSRLVTYVLSNFFPFERTS